LAHAPRAIAYHAQRYGPAAADRRFRTDAEFHAQLAGWRMRPTLAALCKGIAYALARDVRWLARERPRGSLAALVRAPGLRIAQVLGQYVGSRGRGPRAWRGTRDAGAA
jgi:hypothetical protein